MAGVNLLTNPEEYAKRAVEAIELQLTTCKSQARAVRLHSRKLQWEKMIKILENSNEKNGK